MANKLYLLSGNGSIKAWWDDALPYFSKLEPIPLELPGFGANPSDRFQSLDQLAEALLEMTEAGHPIFAAGVNGLVALHALARRPGHFSTLYLMAPVGAFLWKRRFVKLMSPRPIRRTIHWLLRNRPKLFAKKFSSQAWTAEQYQRMGDGYRQCRAFQAYFDFVNPVQALDLLEYVTDRVVLIWGRNDAVLGLSQAAAWDSIIPRADMEVVVKENWEHYPYIDDPQEFATYMESNPQGWRAHSKAGRLQLAALAGLNVPLSQTVTDEEDLKNLQLKPDMLYAVRSSGANEDQIDHSHAGRNHSFLRVEPNDIAEKVRLLLGDGLAEVAVQEFIEPTVSGVAFVRGSATEVEMVSGHPEKLVNGTANPVRFIAAQIGRDWALDPKPNPEIPEDSPTFRKRLVAFLQESIAAFHHAPSDIEWAWDGHAFHLLQLRPVTAYPWRRVVTSANLDEILPKQVSHLMEYAQRRASNSIGRLYALWDSSTLDVNEPFSVVQDDASYINLDLFLSRFKSWGLPSQLLANEIGGSVPQFKFNPWRFLLNVPRFLKMQRVIRRELKKSGAHLREFESELDRILEKKDENQEADLVQWFTRFYVFIVRQNMVINACLSSAGGKFWGRKQTVYGAMQEEESLHRLTYESDPATPRPLVEDALLKVEAFPPDAWAGGIRFLHSLGAPGLGGFYFEVREWFRDNNMRLFHRLHHALKDSDWLRPHPGIRNHTGTFWQDGGGTLAQEHGFVICKGEAQGVVGRNILIVDALDPGQFERYTAADAVVARMGGRLSHGSTLLREIGKPSAVIPDAPSDWEGKNVRYHNGKLEALD